jgi:transposase-like protein
MAKISSAGYRFPAPSEGVNVNFCKNIHCANFGIPEEPHRPYRKKGTLPQVGAYIKVSTAKSEPRMKCCLCGQYPPIRNNAALVDDLARISSYLSQIEPSCPNSSCPMHGTPLSKGGKDYSAFGTTTAGTARWRCNACLKTFTVGGKSTLKHKQPHKNRDVFMLLMNKVALSRIAEITGLDRKSIYGKIDFIHRQALHLIQSREKALLTGFQLPKMYVAVDRQKYLVNWRNRKDRRNVQLNGIGTADLTTGYVFGMHLNFDASVNPAEIEEQAITAGDYDEAPPYRTYSRFWLKPDYEASAARASSRSVGLKTKAIALATGATELTAEILGEYAAGADRDDIEESDEKSRSLMLPTTGIQIHEQYTMQAHFLLMAKMLSSAPKIRVYMDQDSGFRATFMSAFQDRVKDRTADAWYVSALKNATIDEKDQAVAACRRAFNVVKKANPTLTEYEVQVLMTRDAMLKAIPVGFADDWWLEHPLPNKSEPAKRICWLTNLGTYSDDHAARLYLKGSLHAIDRFFMLVRRRLSFAERAYASANNGGRKWYGYNAYNPDNLAKLLDIFRVYYNYCLADADGKTPAMKLGLARGLVTAEDILYFEPLKSKRKPRPAGKVKIVKEVDPVAAWLNEPPGNINF